MHPGRSVARPSTLGLWRTAYAARFGLPDANLRKLLPARLLAQLELAKDDDARRVLLGVKGEADAS